MEAEPTQAGIERQVPAAKITGKVAHVACKNAEMFDGSRDLDFGRGLKLGRPLWRTRFRRVFRSRR